MIEEDEERELFLLKKSWVATTAVAQAWRRLLGHSVKKQEQTFWFTLTEVTHLSRWRVVFLELFFVFVCG